MRELALFYCLSVSLALAQAPNLTSGGNPVKNAPQSPAELTQGTKSLEPVELEGVMRELYASISGPAGQKRDPDRFRNLFLKERGRLAATGKNPTTGEFFIHIMTPDEFIERSFPNMEKNGFFESEVARRTERFGDIIQVWSTYESRHAPAEQPYQRGINGLQLIKDGNTWKILSIFWEGERPDNPLPQQYLVR